MSLKNDSNFLKPHPLPKRFLYIYELILNKNTVTVTMAVLGSFVEKAKLKLFLFVIKLPKGMRQVQLLLLSLWALNKIKPHCVIEP
jgi:hypothetical protein